MKMAIVDHGGERCVTGMKNRGEVYATISPDSQYLLSYDLFENQEGLEHKIKNLEKISKGLPVEPKEHRLWDTTTGKLLAIDNEAKELFWEVICKQVYSVGNLRAKKLWQVGELEGLSDRVAQNIFNHSERVSIISPDSRWVIEGFQDGRCQVYELDWEYVFPGYRNLEEDARIDKDLQPLFQSFLYLHTPYSAEIPEKEKLSFEDIKTALTRSGQSQWKKKDFDYLVQIVRQTGFGWIRPESLQRKLEIMAGITLSKEQPKQQNSSNPTASQPSSSAQQTVKSAPAQRQSSANVSTPTSSQKTSRPFTRQKNRPALLTFLVTFTGLSIILKSVLSLSWLLTLGISFTIAILLAFIIHRLTTPSQKKASPTPQPQTPQPIPQEKINAYRDLLIKIINCPDDASAAQALVSEPHLILVD